MNLADVSSPSLLWMLVVTRTKLLNTFFSTAEEVIADWSETMKLTNPFAGLPVKEPMPLHHLRITVYLINKSLCQFTCRRTYGFQQVTESQFMQLTTRSASLLVEERMASSRSQNHSLCN